METCPTKTKTYAQELFARRMANKRVNRHCGRKEDFNLKGKPIPGFRTDAYYDRVNRRIDRRNNRGKADAMLNKRNWTPIPYVVNPRKVVVAEEVVLDIKPLPKVKKGRKPTDIKKKVKIVLGDK